MFINNEMEKHESYGMLSFSRIVCGGKQRLFGSSINHNHTIRMTLNEGEKGRGLNTDWYYSGKTICEVEMSESQFAELITSLNVGSGVPVTIKHRTNGELIKCEETPHISQTEVHKKEFKELVENTYKDSQALIKTVEKVFHQKKTLTKKDKADIIAALSKISQNIGANMDYQLQIFNEQMEKTVQEAKADIQIMLQKNIEVIKGQETNIAFIEKMLP